MGYTPLLPKDNNEELPSGMASAGASKTLKTTFSPKPYAATDFP
jgi:hypothetical protein